MQPMDEVYREYARVVFGFLLTRTRNEDLAEELTQETFFQAIRSSDRFDESCKVSTWLCGIAKNVLLTYRQKQYDSRKETSTEPDTALRTAYAYRDDVRSGLAEKWAAYMITEDPAFCPYRQDQEE